MARPDETTVDAPSRGWRRAARVFGAVLGGAGGAWLAAHVLFLLLYLRPGVGPWNLYDVAGGLVPLGAYAGMAVVLLSPVAAVLAAAVRRIRGGAPACVLVGAAGGVLWMLSTNSLRPAVIGGTFGAVCGAAGWFAARWASRSAVRVLLLVAIPAGIWTTALLTVA